LLFDFAPIAPTRAHDSLMTSHPFASLAGSALVSLVATSMVWSSAGATALFPSSFRAFGAGMECVCAEQPVALTNPVAMAQSPRPVEQAATPARQAPTEIELAAALLHRSPAEFELELTRVPGGVGSERGRLLSAFAWAVAGERAKAAEIGRGLETLGSLDPVERQGLAAVLGLEGGTTPRAFATLASTAEAPLPRAMRLALLAAEARTSLAAGKSKAAAEALSAVVLGDLEAPWVPDSAVLRRWAADLQLAQGAHRWSSRGDWPGLEVEVRNGEGLQQLRKRAVEGRPDWKICTGLIERCNGIDRVIRPGQKLRLPTDPVTLLVDREARWLLYMLGGEVAAMYEVAVGRDGCETPAGQYEVGKLEEQPMWFPEGRDPVPFGDPHNPLGTRWIGWIPLDGGKQGLGFHGTNQPETIGSAASDGCVRLRNADVEQVYKLVPRGARITIR
jgi:hypothetical protein